MWCHYLNLRYLVAGLSQPHRIILSHLCYFARLGELVHMCPFLLWVLTSLSLFKNGRPSPLCSDCPKLNCRFCSYFGLLNGTSAGFLRTHQSPNAFHVVFTQQLRECVLGSGKKACLVLDTPHLQHQPSIIRVKTPRGKLANSIFTPFADKATTLLLIINGKIEL